jgi:hypothetical protein
VAWSKLVRLLVALALGAVLGLTLRLVCFLVAVAAVANAARLAIRMLDLASWLDPIYTRAALHTIADVRLLGLAIGGPLGASLHQLAPTLFVDPIAARGGIARLVVAPGGAVLGRLLAAGVAHAVVLAFGLLLVRAGWQRRRAEWVVLGVATQGQVALGVLGAPPSLRELEATGLSFAANALLPWLAPRSVAVSDAVTGLALPLLNGVLVAIALFGAYLLAAVLVGLPRLVGRARSSGVAPLVSAVLITIASAGAASAAAWTVEARPFAEPSAGDAAAAIEVPAPLPPAETRRTVSLSADWDRWFAEPMARPSHVEIVGANYQFQYLVNGHPEVIRGMGLNTQYASQLSPAEREARLDADFTAVRALGVNTVLGWDPQEFDETLFDRAQAHGLGVIPPFDLDPAADYTDPEVQASLRHAVLDWVQRFRDQPTLRMWGLGNEVLHKIVHPAWVGPQDRAAARNARAFADWLVATADAIHAADPDHPVTYRSAEDAYVPWVVDALRRRGGGPRPWFVWGTNCYQDYLATIVDEWPELGMDTPLWVSEFAPGGRAVPDRPDGFESMWGYVRRHPDWVFGGAVYAWTRNGPEGVDRTFGLTDDGAPVDGRSLDRLSELFHAPD